MPELPEIEALASYLNARAVTHTVNRVNLTAISALKTYDPPITDLQNGTIEDAKRHGKFLDITVSGTHLIVHLARAGWLRYQEELSPAPLRPGKSPIALRVYLDDGSGFDFTEAGTKKSLAIYVVRRPDEVPGIQRLGPDALDVNLEEFTNRIVHENAQIKKAITTQHLIAGIGNAYSDEILHRAKISPFALTSRLTETQLATLHHVMRETLSEAVGRSVGQRAAELKSEKRTGLQVHGRAGEKCPVCGDTIKEVSFADRALQYCPACQTGGKILADRRLSKLLK